MKVAWDRLVRFEDAAGKVQYGEPILPSHDFDIGKAGQSDELKAKVLVGTDIFDVTGGTYVSDDVVSIKKLLGPLKKADVPIIRCIGLNYAKHSKY